MVFLVLLFIVLPIAEIYVIIKVGEAIGVIPTLVLLIADAVLGSMLWRHQGRAAWIRFNRALAENRLPHKEVFDGVLIIFGGALLVTPGFLTDILGLILLIPPTRAIVRAFASRSVRRRMARGDVTFWSIGRASRPPRGRPSTGAPPPRAAEPDDLFGWEEPQVPPRRAGPQPDDIEGTGHEIRDEDELPPGREPFGG